MFFERFARMKLDSKELRFKMTYGQSFIRSYNFIVFSKVFSKDSKYNECFLTKH